MNWTAGFNLPLTLVHKYGCVCFKAIMAQPKEHTEHKKNINPVVESIFPILTRGDTIPPNANPVAPNRAEAVPEFCRSLSIAKVVEDVNVSPIVKSRRNNNAS